MREAEWNVCTDPQEMLEFLRGKASKRKVNLFCVACCWRLQRLLSDYSKQNLSAVERSADIKPSFGEFTALSDDAMAYADGLSNRAGTPAGYAHWLAAQAVVDASNSNGFDTSLGAACAVECIEADAVPAPPSNGDLAERLAQAFLLRCIFGNPFHPPSLNPAWLTSTVQSLAQTIYDEKAFDRMPILGDGLEEASCSNADILTHCRQPAEHVQGLGRRSASRQEVKGRDGKRRDACDPVGGGGVPR